MARDTGMSRYAQLRLDVHVRRAGRSGVGSAVDWRISAKAPDEDWTLLHTVAFGSERAPSVEYPPSRDDILGAAIEVLMAFDVLDWH